MKLAGWASLVLACVALAVACRPTSRAMARQARYDAYEPSAFYADGGSSRDLRAGTVARVVEHDGHVPTAAESQGAREDGPLDEAVYRRGAERFGIYCTPCHDPAGGGQGTVVARGYPRPPSFVEARLVTAPDEHFERVIDRGLGKMPPYGARVPPADRRAIVAWIRVLQRSQRARLDDAPADERARLLSTRAEAPR